MIYKRKSFELKICIIKTISYNKLIVFYYSSTNIMEKLMKKIVELADSRIEYLHNKDNCNWYDGYSTYIEWLEEELEEVKDEIKENNSVYLEDELWDVFWDFVCLINSLEQDWYIDKKKVIERCFKKFDGRLVDGPRFEAKRWKEIKEKQKLELKREHEEKYW